MENREVRKRIEHVCGRVAGPAGPALTVVIGEQASTTGQDRGGPAPAESTMEIQRLTLQRNLKNKPLIVPWLTC